MLRAAAQLKADGTRLKIDDKPGAISLDVMFVDGRGVYQRSQRHRIQRDCVAGGPLAAC